MRVCLPRFRVLTVEENIRLMHAEVDAAAKRGCRLLVFPEQFIAGYRAQVDPQDLLLEFAEASRRAPGMLVCFGTISADGVNRQCWFKAGRELAHYDKVHLFRPNGEHELWMPGNSYLALEVDGLRIGVGTCNDVRFPDQMLALSRKGKLHILVYPALWPAVRDHVWAALLGARAIEHGAFCLGCCVEQLDNGLEQMEGAGNWVFDPLGNIVDADGRDYELDLQRLDNVLVDTFAEFKSDVEVQNICVKQEVLN